MTAAATRTPPLDLARLSELIAAAKPLPWGWNSYSRIDSVPLSERYNEAEVLIPHDAPDDDPRWATLPETAACYVESIEHGDLATKQGEADARAIEAGMNALPALLSEIARVREALGVVGDWLDEFYGPIEVYDDGDRPGMTQLDHGHEEYEARINVAVTVRAALAATEPAEREARDAD